LFSQKIFPYRLEGEGGGGDGTAAEENNAQVNGQKCGAFLSALNRQLGQAKH
jgi:hypothetical protein